MFALAGLILIVLGVLGLCAVLTMTQGAGIALVVVGVLLLAFDPQVRNRF